MACLVSDPALTPPAPSILSVGSEPVEERYQGAAIRNAFWRLYQADGPGVSLTWCGGQLTYPRDRALLIPGWLEYRFHWRSVVNHRYVHFDLPPWPRQLIERIFPDPVILPDADLGAWLHRLGDRLTTDPAGLVLLDAAALCATTLARVVDRLPATHRLCLLPETPDPFAALRAWIEDHLAEPLAVADLARRSGRSTAAFARAFRAETGTSPLQYILDRRVAHLARLLTTSDLDLDALARAVGFPNRHYLSRRFAERMGIGPAAYRQRWRLAAGVTRPG